MNTKTEPHNLEAEQSVLGAAFMSKSALQKVCEDLSSESFYLDAHSKIYDVIKELYNTNVAVDITTVTDRLKSKKLLKHTKETMMWRDSSNQSKQRISANRHPSYCLNNM